MESALLMLGISGLLLLGVSLLTVYERRVMLL